MSNKPSQYGWVLFWYDFWVIYEVIMDSQFLKQLFTAIYKKDDSTIRNLMLQIAHEQEQSGDRPGAKELRRIAKLMSEQPKTLTPWIEKLSKEAFLTAVPREQLRHDLILPPGVEDQFRQVEQEYAARDRLAHHGLPYSQKILLYGPPGCGKSSGAERIAWNVGLPFLKVRFDALVSSSMGETAKNLRRVMEAATEAPCVLFIDECDAIVKSRLDAQDVGEAKRITNTFLQLLDEYNSRNGLIIAATNLQQLLDDAVWRRFDATIEVLKPGAKEALEIYYQALSSFELGWREEDDPMVHHLRELSAHQIVQAAQNAAKQAVLAGESIVPLEQAEEAIFKFRAFEFERKQSQKKINELSVEKPL